MAKLPVPVEIIQKDSQSNPNRAAEVATELIEKDGVKLLLGKDTPDTTNPVADQAELNGVPCITNNCPWQPYFFGRGDGQDRIFAYGQDAAGDKLQFASDIAVTDVDAFNEGGDLLIRVHNTSDSVRLVGYFSMGPMDRPQVAFASGAVWDAATVDRKVYGASSPIAGTPADEFIEGGRWDEFLAGNDGDDTLYGDAGRDLMDGGFGADIYLFGRGDGQDTVLAGGAMGTGQTDRVLFGAGIDMSNVSVAVDASDLILSVVGSSDSVRVANYFNLYGMDRPRIEFADGSYWDAVSVDRKLQVADDVLMGSPAGDMLDGGSGNDSLDGGEGADWLSGGDGNDDLFAMARKDVGLMLEVGGALPMAMLPGIAARMDPVTGHQVNFGFFID